MFFVKKVSKRKKNSANAILIIVILVIFASICATWIFRTDKGPELSWIQTGTSFSLILVTYIYVRATQDILSESKASRVNAERSLDELIISRKDSLRPGIAFRCLVEEKSSGKAQGLCKSTYLINVGSGLAWSIEFFSNILFQQGQSSDRIGYSKTLLPWVTQAASFGVALGPDTGNPATQLSFLIDQISDGGYSPVEDLRAILLIVYKDCYGRYFYTTQISGKQEIYGPIEEDQLIQVKETLSEDCASLSATLKVVQVMSDN